MLTERQRQEVVVLQEMMATAGWAVFVRDMRLDRDRLNKGILATLTNEKDLFFCKGMDEIMNRVINYDRVLDTAIAQDKEPQVEEE